MRKITMLALILLIICFCSSPTIALRWSGYDWTVRAGHGDPGNNFWSDSKNNVWVDSYGKLHMTIKNSGGKWYCSEIDSTNLYKYGKFTWKVDSPVLNLDKNAVLGLFTYTDDYNELDIETSQWSDAKENHLWYTIQPYTVPGNDISYISPTSSYRTATNVTYTIDWEPTYVRYKATLSTGKVIADWDYTKINGIPKLPGNAIINFWLSNGKPLSNGKNAEIIISSFSHK
jgi:endo-1,3-1,4-beta-glycanase ExoK